MNCKGLLDKISFLFSVAKSKRYSPEDLNYIIALTAEHSAHRKLGRFMGYSISDYAFATSKWIGTEESLKLFHELFDRLPDARKDDVLELIEKEMYIME